MMISSLWTVEYVKNLCMTQVHNSMIYFDGFYNNPKYKTVL